MKNSATMDEALSLEAAETAVAFTECISEIDRHLDEMRREQETIRSIGERTDATLAEIADVVAELRAA